MKDRISPFVWPLAVTALLAPIYGGLVSTDQLGMGPGGLLSAILGDGSIAGLPHALIALPVFVTLFALFLRRRVIQVPSKSLALPLLLLFGLILASMAASAFKMVSFGAALEWITYAAALYATVAACGRNRGPVVIVAAIFIGCAVVALDGIREFGGNRATDPNWRIFATWMDPNALAAMLLVGIFLGIGFSLTQERVVRLISALLTLLLVVAIYLTRSRGALLVLLISLVVLAVLLAVWSNEGRSRRFGRLVGGALVAAIVVVSLGIPTWQLLAPVDPHAKDVTVTQSSGALGRLGPASIGTDQSSYFRRLLWKGCLSIIKDQPLGVGIGTYRFDSARGGYTTQTQLAHETFLQLATETSPVGLALMAAFLIVWAINVARAPEGMPREKNVLRACVVAACFAALAHGVVDSDFYYYGVGICTFMLFGVSILLSADAVSPEFVPKNLRAASAFAIVVVYLGLLYSAGAETLRSKIRGELQGSDAQTSALQTGSDRLADAQSDIGTLLAIAPTDGEAWSLKSRMESSHEAAKTDMETAVLYAPSQRNLRSLAREQLELGQAGLAETTLNRALTTDPNNLNTLSALLVVQQQTNTEQAKQTAERLVAIENTLYFRIRSLPELVPVETYEARLYLASLTPGMATKIGLLRPAVQGFLDYDTMTLPGVLKQAAVGMDYGGETLDRAKKNLSEALEAAHELQRCAASVGDRSAEAEADKAAAAFAASLDSVSK